MKRMLALCLILLLLAGCAAQPAAEPEGLRLWFVTDLGQSWSVNTTALATCGYQGKESPHAMMMALLSGPPADSGLTSPIPKGTALLDWSLEKGILRLYLSRSYSDLVGIDLTLADYCITLTMTQLPDVEGVQVLVSGGDPAWRDRGILYADDVVFSGAEEEPVELSAALYFQRADSGELGYELRIFRLTESELPAKAVLEALTAGPEDSSLTRLIPEGVKVYSARVDAGVCYVDFSAKLLETVPPDEESQILILSSVVETLCGLDAAAVKSVQILVEGETVPSYGLVDISQPLESADSRP